MKKFVFLLVILLLPIMVNAKDYNADIRLLDGYTSVKSLIPVDTTVSVKTEKFDYNNFVYNSSIDEKGNSLITFESIKNNTVSKVPVSINILLFDGDKKNIGFVTYCTDKDLSSNYSGFKLAGGASTSFSISVVDKYFITGEGSENVKYIAVLDENKYCQIGGYDKYRYLTIEEIVNGGSKRSDESGINGIINKIKEGNLFFVIIGILLGLAVLVIIIMVLSKVINKMKENKIATTVVDDSEPMEETINLTYGEVDNSVKTDNNTISMGEVNTLEEDNKPIEENKKEDDDLTKFFN